MENADTLKKLDDIHDLQEQLKSARLLTDAAQTQQRMETETALSLKIGEAVSFSYNDILWALTTTETTPVQKESAIFAMGILYEELTEELRGALKILAADTTKPALADFAKEALEEDAAFAKSDPTPVTAPAPTPEKNIDPWIEQRQQILQIFAKAAEHFESKKLALVMESGRFYHIVKNYPIPAVLPSNMAEMAAILAPVKTSDLIKILEDQSMTTQHRLQALQRCTERFVCGKLSGPDENAFTAMLESLQLRKEDSILMIGVVTAIGTINAQTRTQCSLFDKLDAPRHNMW